MTKLSALLVTACATLVACQTPPSHSVDDLESALATVDADSMLKHIKVLASDEFEGRRPGTAGESMTVQYIVGEFKKLGLKPGNPDGTYVQKVPFVGSRTGGELSFSIGGEHVTLTERADFVAGSAWQIPLVRIDDSELVFVGYGVVAPEYGWDDYKAVDVKGKTVVVLANDPQVPDPEFAGKLDPTMFKGSAVTFYSRSEHKRQVANARGAVAQITLFEPGMFGVRTWKDRTSVFGAESFDTQEADKKLGEVGAGGELSPDAAERLFAATGLDLAALKKAALRKDFQPVAMKAKASFRLSKALRNIESHNVVAKLEGSDPALKDEMIIYTAHWDHFGRDETLQGDQIFNGALDNASGVAAMLEVAKAFSTLKTPPKRTVLFIATTGEEDGLLGAKYYVTHPLFPLERTLAALNIDIINAMGPSRDVGVIGLERSTLGDILSRLATQYGRITTGDLLPELGLFYRADHKEFAAAGVPSIWMRRGMEIIGKPADYGRKQVAAYLSTDYHKVTDQVKPDWDLTGAVDDYRLYVRLGHAIAQAAQWPEWKPGDEFKAKRDAMLKR